MAPEVYNFRGHSVKVYVPSCAKTIRKHSSVSKSVILRTRCHSTWLKHSQRIHSRTDSTSCQIWTC